MKLFVTKASKVLCSFALVFATLAVNATCHIRYYQDELDDQVAALNRFHHE